MRPIVMVLCPFATVACIFGAGYALPEYETYGALDLEPAPALSLGKMVRYWKTDSLLSNVREYRLFCDGNSKVGAKFEFHETSHMPVDSVTVVGDHGCKTKGILVSGGPSYAKSAKSYEPAMTAAELDYLLDKAEIRFDKGRGYNDALGKALQSRYAGAMDRQGAASIRYECKGVGKPLEYRMYDSDWNRLGDGVVSTVCDRDRQSFRIELYDRDNQTRVYQFYDADPQMIERAYRESLAMLSPAF